MNYITDILYWISSGLLVPVVLLSHLLLFAVVVALGRLLQSVSHYAQEWHNATKRGKTTLF